MKNKKPKIICWDIETSLAIVSTFSLYPERISHKNIIQEPFILCVSWKEVGKKEVHSISLNKNELNKKDDYRLVKELCKVLDNCDIAIAHNGDKFDLKWVKGRALKHNLNALAFVKTIDTLKVSRKHFKLMSNRLDYLGDFLGVGTKLSTPQGLWIDVLKGSTTALEKMVKYNKRDVTLLEDVYLKLRPWIDNHPSMSFLLRKPSACKACGGDNTVKYGTRFTNANRYQTHLCNDCGHRFTDTKAIKE